MRIKKTIDGFKTALQEMQVEEDESTKLTNVAKRNLLEQQAKNNEAQRLERFFSTPNFKHLPEEERKRMFRHYAVLNGVEHFF